MLRVCQITFNRITPLDLFNYAFKYCSLLGSREVVHVKKYSVNVTRLSKLPRSGNTTKANKIKDKGFVKKCDDHADVNRHNVQAKDKSPKQKLVGSKSQNTAKGTKEVNNAVTKPVKRAKAEKSQNLEKQKKEQGSSREHTYSMESAEHVTQKKSFDLKVSLTDSSYKLLGIKTDTEKVSHQSVASNDIGDKVDKSRKTKHKSSKGSGKTTATLGQTFNIKIMDEKPGDQPSFVKIKNCKTDQTDKSYDITNSDDKSLDVRKIENYKTGEVGKPYNIIDIKNDVTNETLEETHSVIQPSKNSLRVKDDGKKKKISHLLKRELYDGNILKEKVIALLMDDKTEVSSMKIRKEQMYLASEAWSRGLKVDISIYNCLIRSCAKQGDFSKVTEILRELDLWDVTPDLQTYAHCLECLARSEKFDEVEGFQVLSRIIEENFDVRDIYNECSFVKDEWFYVEKALKTLDPDFEAHPPPPPSDYSCEIVQALNSPVKSGVEMPHKDALNKEEILTNCEKQLKWEMDGHVLVSTKFDKREGLTPKTLLMRKRLETMKKQWHKTLTHQFQKKIKESQFLPHKSKHKHVQLVPFLRLLPASDFADLLIMELEDILETCTYLSPATWYMHKLLGQKVLDKCILRYNQENDIMNKKMAMYKEYLDYFLSDHQQFRSHRECWEAIIKHKNHRYGPTLDKPSLEWRQNTLINIGQWLHEILVDHVTFDTKFIDMNAAETKTKKQIPVMYIKNQTYGNHIVEEIMPHPAMTRFFHQCRPKFKKFDASFMPMLVPPVPWKSRYTGGMLIKPAEMVKCNRYFVRENAVDTVLKRAGDINPVLDALNILSSCPWKINQPILDLMLQVFNSKKGNKKLNIAPHLSTLPTLPVVKTNMSKKEIFSVYEARKRMKKIHMENYSLWCTTLYQLAIANKLRNNTIWFPHNIDFRGRAYPISPSLNYMGNDLMRGLLLFAKGKCLGEEGFKWLKIHVINLMGSKKRASNRERLEYADEMMDEILDSADKPMTGNKWWQASEDPWTTLAACKEIAAAIRSGNPATYISQLPIHQDGSCNGLQHYAALGRDQKGGESVNLCPFDEPKDVYSDVVELVEEQRAKHAKNGYKLAQDLDGYVTRKTIKQTVMTTVYGVTLYGAMHQIKKNMSEVEGKMLDEDIHLRGSVYLAKTTLNTMGKIFHASREIQDWFIRCATVLSKHRKTLTEWETPLGLPVVQPYSKKSGSHGYRPNTMKQKNSFPPNFIHSLDATHMMMTALHCQTQGITYVSVHDCYWTHACDVDTMNKITREQFVLLHSQPILENMSKFLLEKFGEHPSKDPKFREKKATQEYIKNVFSKVPSRGNLDLNNVLDSVYFFS